MKNCPFILSKFNLDKHLNEGGSLSKEYQKGLEVNTSEGSTNLKIESYQSFMEINDNKLKTGKFLLPGDIVFIYNRRTNSRLCVTDRGVNKYFVDR